LDAIDQDAISAYQPYWAVRAHFLQLLGKGPEAQHAYDRAIGLAEDPAVREFLLQKRG
jgi:RNA polymerase sigma-70 factor (ECF subfamily)